MVTITALIIGAVIVTLPNPVFNKTSNKEAAFLIERGQPLSSIAESLSQQHLVVSGTAFVIYARLTGQEKKFKAGSYKISTNASIRELVKTFAEGRSEPDDVVVTIPEGTNLADIDRTFSKAGLTKKGDFLNPKSSVLKLEGFLFPDTYRFRPSEPGRFLPVEEVIKKMSNNFDVKTRDLLTGYSADRGGTAKIYRTIIIASILEKEVKTEEDMRLVAGIIEKRIELGMSIEIDATVAYGVCYPVLLVGKYCDVSLANIVDNIPVDSVYNTYKRKGLPFGPISNPGLKAIRAAVSHKKPAYNIRIKTAIPTIVRAKL